MSDIQAVKQRADIVDIIGQYVPLVRRGKLFQACCPFHQEKTPSFTVDPGRQTWHCWGACSTGGDVFQFLMRRDSLSFPEALHQLAAQVGVELKDGDRAPREDYSRLVEANEAAAQYFHHQLLNAPQAEAARAYVLGRGVDEKTLGEFQLGYAHASYETLRDHLTARNFTLEELVQAGLLAEGEHRPYDRFRDRLIFPIRDERGRAIGFGGRVLGEGVPKYLNTSQTALFDKSGTLYALDRARDAIRSGGVAVVVEGYMDVIAAHQFGIRNVVATLGTALTERHVQILKRYARQVKLAMDADAAGIEAAMRGDDVVRRAGETDPDAPGATIVGANGLVAMAATAAVDVRAFKVSVGKDPDDAIRADPMAFLRDAQGAQPLFEFRLQHELAKVDRRDSRALLELADRLLPSVAAISDRSVQAQYLARLAVVTGAREQDLVGRMRGAKDAPARPATLPMRERADRAPVVADPRPAGAALRREQLCLRLLYEFPSLRTDGMLIEESLFTDAANLVLFQVWRGSPDVTRVAELLDGTMQAQLFEILQLAMPPCDEAKAAQTLADIANRMRLQRLEEQKRVMAATLFELEAEMTPGTIAAEAVRALDKDQERHEGAEGDAGRRALDDLELGRSFHQLERALRMRGAAPPS